MPEFNTSVKTTAVAGSTLEVSWCGSHPTWATFVFTKFDHTPAEQHQVFSNLCLGV